MKVLSADGLTKLIQLVKTTFSTKQDSLISGTNIKTVNNQSLLGSGNITISSGSTYTAGNYIDITNNVISGKVSTNTSLTESLEKPYYAWTYGNTTYYTESSTPTASSDLYTMPSTNTFVKSTTSEIKSVSSGSISIKEDKDYQAWTYNGTTYYTLGESPSVGDTLYIKEDGEFVEYTGLQITAVSSNSITLDQNEFTVSLALQGNVRNCPFRLIYWSFDGSSYQDYLMTDTQYGDAGDTLTFTVEGGTYISVMYDYCDNGVYPQYLTRDGINYEGTIFNEGYYDGYFIYASGYDHLGISPLLITSDTWLGLNDTNTYGGIN